ncbi:MAG: hypothetical protein VXW29_01355, partial [SAR324 cluster bacterium]|nr:hypothetical protein [SAR324 cluster bacterium]
VRSVGALLSLGRLATVIVRFHLMDENGDRSGAPETSLIIRSPASLICTFLHRYFSVYKTPLSP